MALQERGSGAECPKRATGCTGAKSGCCVGASPSSLRMSRDGDAESNAAAAAKRAKREAIGAAGGAVRGALATSQDPARPAALPPRLLRSVGRTAVNGATGSARAWWCVSAAAVASKGVDVRRAWAAAAPTAPPPTPGGPNSGCDGMATHGDGVLRLPREGSNRDGGRGSLPAPPAAARAAADGTISDCRDAARASEQNDGALPSPEPPPPHLQQRDVVCVSWRRRHVGHAAHPNAAARASKARSRHHRMPRARLASSAPSATARGLLAGVGGGSSCSRPAPAAGHAVVQEGGAVVGVRVVAGDFVDALEARRLGLQQQQRAEPVWRPAAGRHAVRCGRPPAGGTRRCRGGGGAAPRVALQQGVLVAVGAP